MTNHQVSAIESSNTAGETQAEPPDGARCGWYDMIALGHRGVPGSRPDPMRAAAVFIDQLGDRAEARAARIATEWMSEGNESGAAWLVDVCDAIHELGRTERHPGEAVH